MLVPNTAKNLQSNTFLWVVVDSAWCWKGRGIGSCYLTICMIYEV